MTAEKQSQLDSLQTKARAEFAKGLIGLGKEDHSLLKCKTTVLTMDLVELSVWHSSISLARASYQRVAEQQAPDKILQHRRSKRFLEEFLSKGRATIPDNFGVPKPRPNQPDDQDDNSHHSSDS